MAQVKIQTPTLGSSDSTSNEKLEVKPPVIQASLQEVITKESGYEPPIITKDEYLGLTPDQLKEKLLKYHNQKLMDAPNIMAGDLLRACYDKVINCSGGTIMLPDFNAREHDPGSELTFPIAAGERYNLLGVFETKQINKNRMYLENQLKAPGLHGLPALLCVEDLQIQFPWPLVQKSILDRVKDKGLKTVELPVNRYDEEFMKVVKKEADYNKKIMERPGTGDLKDRPTPEQFEKTIS